MPKKLFLFLRKEYETPLGKFEKGFSTYSYIWASLLGLTHEDFMKKFNEDEIFRNWFSERKDMWYYSTKY
jgi:hypothetical protein